MKNSLTLKATAVTLALVTALSGTAHANTSSNTQVLNTEETKDYVEIIKAEAASQGYNIDFGGNLPTVTMPEFAENNDSSVYANSDVELTDAAIGNIDAEVAELEAFELNYLNGVDTNPGQPLSNATKQQLLNTMVNSFAEDGISIDFRGNMPAISRIN